MKYLSSVKLFVQACLVELDVSRGPTWEQIDWAMKKFGDGDIAETLNQIATNQDATMSGELLNDDWVEFKKALEAVYKRIPEEDWNEIVAYIKRHYESCDKARKKDVVSEFPFPLLNTTIGHRFLSWLAAVGVELLAEL